MIRSKAMVIDDDGVDSPGITQKTGEIFIEVTKAATGVHYSAVYTVHDEAGTVTTTVKAGNAAHFYASNSDTRVCVYWDDGEIKVKNRLGTKEMIFLTAQMI